MKAIGIDIGGANIKVADSEGRATARSFEIWKSPAQLSRVLSELLIPYGSPDVFAVTMTAELADCFDTKARGVDTILSGVEEVAGKVPVYVWQTGAEFVAPDVAREIPLLVAASNWHAEATWIGRMVPEGTSVLIDVGSTTTDIIPLSNGVPVPIGLTDRERLQSGELVYSGVRRTPLCAVAHTVPFRGGYCPLAAEFFAGTLDVYLLLEMVPEQRDDCDTADRRPATRRNAHNRVARMLCCDGTEVGLDDTQAVAHFLADVQTQRIAAAVERVLARQPDATRHVLVAGSGEFLASQVAANHRCLHDVETTRLSCTFDQITSETACAAAVATLAIERLAGLA